MFRCRYSGVAESVELRLRLLRSGPGTLAPFGGRGAGGATRLQLHHPGRLRPGVHVANRRWQTAAAVSRTVARNQAA